ncbi:V-type ATPase subunit, partial [Chlamydia psittaci 84-8471/1]
RIRMYLLGICYHFLFWHFYQSFKSFARVLAYACISIEKGRILFREAS